MGENKVKGCLLGDVTTVGYWRDILVEFFATFLLVAVQCSLPLTWGDGVHGNAVQVGLGMGFVVTAIAWCLGNWGGAHMNPAVSISMMVCLKLPLLKGVFYIIAQSISAIAAAGFLYGVTPAGSREGLAATTLGTDVAGWQGFLVETWITFILVLTIHGATDEPRRGAAGAWAPIPIGMAICLGIMCGFKHTGGSMNPARSFGPAVVMGIWSDHWVYWIGPIVGGVLATAFYVGLLGLMDRKDKKNKQGSSHQELVEGNNSKIHPTSSEK